MSPFPSAALTALEAVGLHDNVRERWPSERVFTYWDDRSGMFHQDLGMRRAGRGPGCIHSRSAGR